MNNDVQLPKEKLDECKEIFDYYDRDKDGAIHTKELGDLMRALGANPTKENLKEMISEVDKDGSSKITFKKFILLLGKSMNDPNKENNLLEAFKVFDQDNKGLVSAQELRHVLTSVAEKLTKQEADEMIKEANPDKEGFIHYREFIKIMITK